MPTPILVFKFRALWRTIHLVNVVGKKNHLCLFFPSVTLPSEPMAEIVK